jgi:hypothetical protein
MSVTESISFGPSTAPKASGEIPAPRDESCMIGNTRRAVLKTAGDLIDGDRARDYGDAFEMHKRIASGWSQILGIDVRAHEVALCMTWLKISRIVESPSHADSYVDAVAYMALAAEIEKRDSAKAG